MVGDGNRLNLVGMTGLDHRGVVIAFILESSLLAMAPLMAQTYPVHWEELTAADFTKALEEDPQQPHTYFARAESRSAMGDSAGAKADITAGRKLDGW